jgi:hypothetical protein
MMKNAEAKKPLLAHELSPTSKGSGKASPSSKKKQADEELLEMGITGSHEKKRENLTWLRKHLMNLMGILAGLLSIGVPIYDFANLSHFQIFALVHDIYSMIFGGLVIWLEVTEFLPKTNRVRLVIREWFRFISIMTGRGTFFIFIGSFFAAQFNSTTNQLHFYSGVYMISLGVLFIIVGILTQEDEDLNRQLENDVGQEFPAIRCAGVLCRKEASRFQCPVCAQAGTPLAGSTFCTQECFERSWKEHKRIHPAKEKDQPINTT